MIFNKYVYRSKTNVSGRGAVHIHKRSISTVRDSVASITIKYRGFIAYHPFRFKRVCFGAIFLFPYIRSPVLRARRKRFRYIQILEFQKAAGNLPYLGHLALYHCYNKVPYTVVFEDYGEFYCDEKFPSRGNGFFVCDGDAQSSIRVDAFFFLFRVRSILMGTLRFVIVLSNKESCVAVIVLEIMFSVSFIFFYRRVYFFR